MSTNATLAAPPGECCIKTVQHEGTAVGAFEALGGVNTYVSHPPTRADTYDRILLFFSDVYSASYINNQLLCDYFAAQGFLVLALEYFEGDPVYLHRTPDNPNFDFAAWANTKRARATELVPPFVAAAKEKYGHEKTKYAAVGYCFGAPHAMTLGATDEVSAVAFAHPSALDEDSFRNVKQPLFLSCAEIDRRFPIMSRHRAEEILIENQATFTLQVFSGVQHGFAVRCDLSNEQQRWAKEESARSIVGWFTRFCT